MDSHGTDTQYKNEVDLGCLLADVSHYDEAIMTYGDGRLVHGAVGLGEEDVHDDGDSNATQVHAESRANEETAP